MAIFRRLRALVLAFALIGIAAPASSLVATSPGVDAAETEALEALRAQDVRVATIAFRLMTEGLDLCERRAPQAGLVLHDAAQYSAALRPVAVRHFRLGEGPSISAVVPGGPAALARLRADDALVAVAGVKLEAGGGRARRATYDGVAQAMAALDAAFAGGPTELTVRRGERTFDAEIRPVSGCSSEVQLIPSSKMNAEADGHYVQVTSAIVDYVANDDELAVVIGHELAHNILGHRAKLDAVGVGTGLLSKFGRQAARIRATEIEADRTGLYLMARAGYDIEAAPTFWRRFGREHGPGIFADATHPGWRKREELLKEMIGEIRARQGRHEPVVSAGLP
jgi:hypothetical protein